MAKTRQYSRGRRTVLQVTLGAVLLGITALAAYVSHVHAGGLKVILAPPQQVGNLTVRIPQEWTRAEVASPGQAVEFTEPPILGKSRSIKIYQRVQDTPRLSAAGLLAADLDAGPEMKLERFTLMGQPGILAEMGAYDTQFGEHVDGGICAAAVFPDGFAVSIRITSPQTLGPSNRRLLKLITENMALADFQCRPEHPGDQTTVQRIGDEVTIDVVSPSGIGRATLRPLAGHAWPRKVTVRLKNMKTLEGFSVRAGALDIHSALGQQLVEVRRSAVDGSAELPPPDPKYAMDIRMDGPDITILLPSAIEADAVPGKIRDVQIEWIDTYRE